MRLWQGLLRLLSPRQAQRQQAAPSPAPLTPDPPLPCPSRRLLISTPLAYSGGMLAARREIATFPTRTNQIPRHVPPPHWASHPAVLLLAAGLLPFGTIFVELYFAMTSMWQVGWASVCVW